jgi:hypothetical protein
VQPSPGGLSLNAGMRLPAFRRPNAEESPHPLKGEGSLSSAARHFYWQDSHCRSSIGSAGTEYPPTVSTSLMPPLTR